MLSETLLYWASRPVVLAYMKKILTTDVLMHARMPQGAKIIAANHPSTTDPFFVAGMLRQQSFILIKDLLFQVPLLGSYLHHSGHIPVVARRGPEAMQAAVQRLRQGQTVIIFPEGELSPEDGFHPARTGVARLALLSGAPVIPVGIHLLHERARTIKSTVRGEVTYSRWYLRGPYNLTAGRSLHFGGDVEDRIYVRSVAEQVMRHIIALARESELRMQGALPGLPAGAQAG